MMKKLLVTLGIITTVALGGSILGDEKAEVGRITAPDNNAYKIGVFNYEYDIKDDVARKGQLEYKLDNEYFRIKPLSIGWDGSIIDSPEKRVVDTRVSKEQDNTFRSILGTGVDIKITPTDRVLSKVVKIESPESIPTPSRSSQNLEVSFEVETNMVVDGWDKKSPFTFNKQVRIGDYSYIKAPIAWDSSKNTICNGQECYDEPNVVNIEAELSEKNGKFYLTKRIPNNWLRNATYPVYTDADITYGSMQVASTSNSVILGHYTGDKLTNNAFVFCLGGEYAPPSFAVTVFCYAATVSGSTITFGAPSAAVANDVLAGAVGPSGETDTCAFDSNTIAYIYADDDLLDDGYIVAADITGTTFGAWGTAVEFETGDMEHPSCVNIADNKIAISYNDESNSDTGSGVVCTASGTTITCGTVDDYAVTDYYPVQIDTAKLNDNKFVTCFHPQTDVTTIHCFVATVSTRTITWGSAYDTGFTHVAPIGNNNNLLLGTAGIGTDQFLLAFASSTGTLVSVCTVSSTTPTCGTPSAADAKNDAFEWLQVVQAGIGSASGVLINPAVSNDDGVSYLLSSINWGARTLTIGSAETFESGDVYQANRENTSAIFPIDTNKIVICYENNTPNPDEMGCIVGEIVVAGTPAPTFKQDVFYFD